MASDQVVQITSATFNSSAFTGVTSVSYDDSGESTENRADADIYATAQKLTSAALTGSVEGIDQEAFAGVAIGTSAAFVVTGKRVSDDTIVTLTLSNCMMLGVSTGQNHSDSGSATLTFKCTSSDGTTSPAAYTTA